jgi:hypothetical protein
MSLDLTGGLIVSFLLDELRPVLARHPRYRENAGETFQTFANTIMFRDVSATIGNLRGDSSRLSPDYFLATAWGRALLAQVNGKPGSFIEWLQEIDPTKQTPAPGMYLLAVASVNEQTRQLQLISTYARTLAGKVESADGTVIAVDPAIPLALVQPTDSSIPLVKAGTRMWLTQYAASISLVRSDTGGALAPGVDWWLERTVTLPLGVTTGAAQYFLRPDGLADLQVLDGNGQVLIHGINWNFTGDGRIRLQPGALAGQTYSARGLMRVDPRSNPLVHPENCLPITLATGETLTPGSVHYQLPAGSFVYADTVTDSGGNIYSKYLLTPGDDLSWEAYTATPQVYVNASKMAMSAEVIPGLNLAFGDMAEAGDQCSILVNPEDSETYHIYGGKDSLSFDLSIKTNDLNTSSELANLARSYLLVKGRNRMEAAGITIHAASYAYAGEQRDASGTAVSHSVVLNVIAQADWEHYEPIISGVAAIDLDLVVTEGKASPLTKAGRTQFISSYF